MPRTGNTLNKIKFNELKDKRDKKDKREQNFNAGHRERFRQRFLNNGLDDFVEDHEVLEILLYYCYPRINTNRLAHKLLYEFGSLYNLFEAMPTEICERCGVTPNTAMLLAMMSHLAKRYYKSKWSAGTVLDTSEKAGSYATSLFIGEVREFMYLICMDKKYKLIYPQLISEGTVDGASVYPREAVRAVIRHNATKVVIAHNHPGGSLNVSDDDIITTRRIVNALALVNTQVCDHIIVTGDMYCSFSEKNMLNLRY